MNPIFRVTVTQEDIDRGLRHSAMSCPIANALRRKVGNGHLIQAHGTYCTFFFWGKWREYLIPYHVQEIMDVYHRQGGKIEPFSFTLDTAANDAGRREYYELLLEQDKH